MRAVRLLAALAVSAATFLVPVLPTQAATSGPVIDNASLYNGGQACSAASPIPVGWLGGVLQAVGTDAAPSVSRFAFTFAIWPTADPAAQTQVTASSGGSGALATGQVPDSVLVGGTSYSWRVQLTDDNGTSPWSQTCLFTFDVSSPSAPTVTSANFPPASQGTGPIGEPAQFTFDGHGDPDTAGFAYVWGVYPPAYVCTYNSGPQGQLVCPDPFTQSGTIRANAPGGTASVTLSPPDLFGTVTLSVAAMDQVGNRSQWVQYQILPPYTPPTITVAQQPICGGSATISFAPYPGVQGVTSYSYSVDGDNRTGTVAADAQGNATFTLPVTTSDYAIRARSNSANGYVSPAGYGSLDVHPLPSVQADIYVNSGQPVGGPGVTGTFTFSPPYDGHFVSGYQYRFGRDPFQTVAADPDWGTASVQYTPKHPGPQTLTVQSLNADAPGGSCQLSYTFRVADPEDTSG
jgi:hypothetical protein